MTDQLGHHAVVVGGSVAGLMTARVLADYFDRVTLFERDQIGDRPAIHKSIPQGNHAHALLFGGQRVMSSFFPGFTEELKRLGAVPVRSGIDAVTYGPAGKSHTFSGSEREPRDLGIETLSLSRGLLEHVIRKRTTALANVKFEMGVAIEGLLHDNRQVRGVRCDRAAASQLVEANLVVDASGRASHTPRWLTEMGLPTPEETTIGVDFAYTSTKYRKPRHCDLEPLAFFVSSPPSARGGVILEIEDNTWHVSLGGRFGDFPPTSEDGFLAFARTLPSRLYEAIKDAERSADITHHRFPTSVQRHYERLSVFPDNFLLVGDAIASFNPVYGQGMTSAAQQVQALQQILSERAADSRGLGGLSSAFFHKAAEVVSAPWTLAAWFDFANPQTKGERPPDLAEDLRYLVALDALQSDDVEVQRVIAEVFGLTKPLSALREEPLRSRVLARW